MTASVQNDPMRTPKISNTTRKRDDSGGIDIQQHTNPDPRTEQWVGPPDLRQELRRENNGCRDLLGRLRQMEEDYDEFQQRRLSELLIMRQIEEEQRGTRIPVFCGGPDTESNCSIVLTLNIINNKEY
jgi:hypothetical protein